MLTSVLLFHPAQSLARALNDSKVPSRGGVERAQPAPSPSGNSPVLALTARAWPSPSPASLLSLFPLAIMSVHQRLGPAKRRPQRGWV